MLDQTISVPDNVVDCFKYCTVDQNLVCLPSRDAHSYEEKTFSSFKSFLGKYKAKWLSTKQAFQLPFLARPFVDMVLSDNEAPKPNPLAYFPTPKPIIDCMFNFADINSSGSIDGLRILEPNGGGGAILDMLSQYASDTTTLHTCELDPINRACLRDKGYKIVGDDFLRYQPDHKYDLVIANPPYSVQSDPLAYITHLNHALSLLSPFGKLVAVIPTAFEDGDNKIKSQFRELCFENAEFDFEEFPEGSFENTAIKTTVIVIGGSKLADPTIPNDLLSDYKNIFEERAHHILANDSDTMLVKIPSLLSSFDESLFYSIVESLFSLAIEHETRLPRKYLSDYQDLVQYELDRCRSEQSVSDALQDKPNETVEVKPLLESDFGNQLDIVMDEISEVLNTMHQPKTPKQKKNRKEKTSISTIDQFELAF